MKRIRRPSQLDNAKPRFNNVCARGGQCQRRSRSPRRSNRVPQLDRLPTLPIAEGAEPCEGRILISRCKSSFFPRRPADLAIPTGEPKTPPIAKLLPPFFVEVPC